MTATNSRRLVTGLTLGTLCFALGGAAVGADDDDFGAYIYAGTCDSQNGPARFDIGDLDSDDADDRVIVATPAAGMTGTTYSEDEDISATLDDLTGSPHAVVVRERDDENSPIVACGDIAGTATNGELRIDLRSVNDSGISGVALFGPNHDDSDDDPTDVFVQVQRGADGGMATPSA